MNIDQLKPGIYRVRITDTGGTVSFNLSVRQSYGLLFAGGFMGDKKPRRLKHLMLTDSVRNWIGEMELVNPEPQNP